jgi:hypothetical protein
VVKWRKAESRKAIGPASAEITMSMAASSAASRYRNENEMTYQRKYRRRGSRRRRHPLVSYSAAAKAIAYRRKCQSG